MSESPDVTVTQRWLRTKGLFDTLLTPYLEEYNRRGGNGNLVFSEDYQRGGPISRQIFEKFYPFIDNYLQIVKGRRALKELRIDLKVLNLPQRVFKKSHIDDLRPQLQEPLSNLIDLTFEFGIFLNGALTDCPTRQQFETVEFDQLFPHFVLESMGSLTRIEDYVRDVSSLPLSVWELFYNNHVVRVMEEELGLRRWRFVKQGKMSSHLRFLFFSGVLFGFWIDIEPQVREDRHLKLDYGMDHFGIVEKGMK